MNSGEETWRDSSSKLNPSHSRVWPKCSQGQSWVVKKQNTEERDLANGILTFFIFSIAQEIFSTHETHIWSIGEES